jgi:hypothetical protein
MLSYLFYHILFNVVSSLGYLRRTATVSGLCFRYCPQSTTGKNKKGKVVPVLDELSTTQ